MAGDGMALAKATLPEDSLRMGKEWKEPPMLLLVSSSPGVGDDMILEERLGNKARGGARPNSSKDPCFGFSGELVAERLCCDDGGGRGLSLRAGDRSGSSGGWSDCDRVSLCMGEGDRSWRAPQRSGCSTELSCRPLEISRACCDGMAGTGVVSSGVGGIRLIRGCMDLGLSSGLKASSTSVLKPSPDESWSGESPCSDAESCDMDRK